MSRRFRRGGVVRKRNARKRVYRFRDARGNVHTITRVAWEKALEMALDGCMPPSISKAIDMDFSAFLLLLANLEHLDKIMREADPDTLGVINTSAPKWILNGHADYETAQAGLDYRIYEATAKKALEGDISAARLHIQRRGRLKGGISNTIVIGGDNIDGSDRKSDGSGAIVIETGRKAVEDANKRRSDGRA